MKVAALLLAAGESTRMGVPKPLLPWGDTTLVRYQVEQLKAAGATHVIVVVGHEAGAVRAVLEGSGAQVIQNPEYRQGRASSVRHGAAALPVYAEAAVILNVDQPRPSAVIRRAIQGHEAQGGLITIPTHAGRRGHPTVFSNVLFAEMVRATEQGQGLREIVQRHGAEIHHLELDSLFVTLDMNTPEEYETVKALFGVRE